MPVAHPKNHITDTFSTTTRKGSSVVSNLKMTTDENANRRLLLRPLSTLSVPHPAMPLLVEARRANTQNTHQSMTHSFPPGEARRVPFQAISTQLNTHTLWWPRRTLTLEIYQMLSWYTGIWFRPTSRKLWLTENPLFLCLSQCVKAYSGDTIIQIPKEEEECRKAQHQLVDSNPRVRNTLPNGESYPRRDTSTASMTAAAVLQHARSAELMHEFNQSRCTSVQQENDKNPQAGKDLVINYPSSETPIVSHPGARDTPPSVLP